MTGYVYMTASQKRGTIYIGVTNDLARRVLEHKGKISPGFTRKHGVDILVWFEEFADINDAIVREKQIKGWNRAWKIRMIEKANPVWNDLTPHIL